MKKVLVANRGEIACRVIKSIQKSGLTAVAVHSEPDKGALFVQLADEAVALGGSSAAESYLSMDKVISAAHDSGSDAIHPGYGFLSENADFSARCEAEGITFIGPSASAIKAMGNKAEAKRLMLASAVPCIPGYQESDQADERLVTEAEVVGYPLMVKAAAGGGGRGIRQVSRAEDLPGILSAARIEAQNAFGNTELILEKLIVDGRHIEIQVAADSHGHTIHLGERDCSVQRRHQKVIEEAPSPFMTEQLRAEMGQAAVSAAEAVQYCGVGTVEFLVDAQQNFYFLEMNTRLQVEHPVTEMVTGIDLVDWQLRIAAGGQLPLTQQEVCFEGHAIEVRIYAEDPANNYMPQTGVLQVFEPALGDGIRIDHGVCSGSVVSPYYDSMLAKLIAWGSDREEARLRLMRALVSTRILGLITNKTFLLQLLSEPKFADGEATTSLIDEELLARTRDVDVTLDVALAAAIIHCGTGPFANWSNAEPMPQKETLEVNGESISVQLLQTESGFDITVGESDMNMKILSKSDQKVTYIHEGITRSAGFLQDAGNVFLDMGDRTTRIERTTYHPAAGPGAAGSGRITATTEGLVIDVVVKPGDQVKLGDTLVVIEAMKMEHRHLADGDGEVMSVSVNKDQQVKNRQPLVELKLTGEGEEV